MPVCTHGKNGASSIKSYIQSKVTLLCFRENLFKSCICKCHLCYSHFWDYSRKPNCCEFEISVHNLLEFDLNCLKIHLNAGVLGKAAYIRILNK